VIAELLGYTVRWVRTVIGRWNVQGEAGIQDRRHEIDVSRPLLSSELQEDLAAALQAPPADGGLWSGPKVAQWVLPLEMVDNSVTLCKDTSGWYFHLEAVRRGHLSLE
jgi:hypothetical protein